jgi:hypothetical protein
MMASLGLPAPRRAIRRPGDEAELDRTMKSREEQLTWAKQRALICVDMGGFSDAVAGLRADLAENLAGGFKTRATSCFCGSGP